MSQTNPYCQITLFAALAAAICLTACGGGKDSGSDQAAVDPLVACTTLADTQLRGTSLKTKYVAAGTKPAGGITGQPLLPGHCVVSGSIDPHLGIDGVSYATGFELSLPDAWNGRFLFLGAGGNDGVITDTSKGQIQGSTGSASPLAQGFAVVATDGGHSTPSSLSTPLFAVDAVARLDSAYPSNDKTYQAAMALIQARMKKSPDRSYFVGCSGGGRQGMAFSQRFPSYFDGIVAGDPAMRSSSGATAAVMWRDQKLTSIAPQDASGSRILSRALSDGDLALVSKAVTASCDAKDGVADGMVQNVSACNFDPSVLQCSGAKTDSCMSAPQVSAMADVFKGPRNSAGQPLYFPSMWTPSIDAVWRGFVLGSSTTTVPNSLDYVLMVAKARYQFPETPNPAFDPLSFDFDTGMQQWATWSAIYDTHRDDRIDPFFARGGKIIFTHGTADPLFSPYETIDYYQRLTANHGGRETMEKASRLFLVPDMGHCSGGRATDTFDVLTPLVAWVEKGIAPDTIQASAPASSTYFPGRTRPLCVFPKYAKYKGSGSIEDAASFVCTED